MKHVEMIIDYTTDGTDYQYNDNHGLLIRCRDCRFYENMRCFHIKTLDDLRDKNDYCSFAKLRGMETEHG